MAELVVGAVVSAAYTDLYNLVKQAVVAAAWCKRYCRALAADLELLRPSLDEICSAMQQDPAVYAPWGPSFLAFQDRLEEGKTLVEDCLRVKRFDLFSRYCHGKSILKLEKDIASFSKKLPAVITQMLSQQQTYSLQHNDRLAQVAHTQLDFGQRLAQQLQELARDQVELAHEHDLHLQQLSQQLRDHFAELDEKHKLQSDELKETVDCVIEIMAGKQASFSAIAASLQQLAARLAQDGTSSIHDHTSGIQDTFMLPPLVVGIDHSLMEVKEQLLAKQQEVMLVGLKGMGGIGKTTLALALCQDAEIKAFFKGGIHFQTVSQSPNMLELYKVLWTNLIGGTQPFFQNEEDAQRQLQGAIRRMESPVLLVLDDVWSTAHLEKLAFEGEQCRILYTTRQVSKLPVKNIYLYELGLLSEEYAHRLFCFWAFGQESVPDWADAFPVKEVQDECKCLPLALRVIGGSLSGEQMVVAWQNAKKRLRQAQMIGDYHSDELLKRLQTSFDVLHVQLKQCFIDFGSFPEDTDVPVHVLYDVWVSVRGMEWDDAVMALAELSSRCLVDVRNCIRGRQTRHRRTNVLVYGCTQEIVCRQHDVMRDLALYLGRKAFVPNPRSLGINHEDFQPDMRKWLLMPHREQEIPRDWQPYGTEGHFRAEIVSINTGTMAEEDWPHGMNFSETQALLLYTDGDSYSLPPFVESMSELKVLLLRACHSCRGFEAIERLINLQSIHLEMLNICDVSEYFRALKKLRKVYVSDCWSVHRASGGARGFASNFSSCPELTDFTLRGVASTIPNQICKELGALRSLKRLFFSNCFVHNLPDDIGHNLSNLVLLSIEGWGLKALPDSLCKLQQLQHLNVSRCAKLQSLPKDLGQLSSLKDLLLQGCSSLKVLPSSITRLRSLEVLSVSECERLESLPEDLGKISKLRILELEYCTSLKKLPSTLELRALKAVSFDDKWAEHWEAMKDNTVGLVMTVFRL